MASGFQKPINAPMKEQLKTGARAGATGGVSVADKWTGNNLTEGSAHVGGQISGGGKHVASQIGANNPYRKVKTDVPQADESRLMMIENQPGFDQAGFGTQAFDTSKQDQFRQGQSAVATMLQQQALGQGPSIAATQMQQGQAAALAASRAALASSRGGASPMAARQALMGNQQMQAGLAEKAGLARLQEQQVAAQNYGNIAQQARAQDIDVAQQQAAQQNEFNTLRANYQKQGMSAQEANQRAALDYEKIRLGQSTAQAQADAAAKMKQQEQVAKIIQEGAGAAMKAAML
jgi:hypothetical protein